jgi:hypothetical protein
VKIPEPDWNDIQLREDQIVSAHSVTATLLYRGRNAWHSTWVQHYIRQADLFPSIDDAKAGAERLRSPGNVFYIKEVPALVLVGIRQSLILVDPNSDTCFERFSGFRKEIVVTSFGNFAEGLYAGCPLKDAHNTVIDFQRNWKLGKSGEKLILTGVLESGFPAKEIKTEFSGFSSESHGGKYMLGWNRMSNRYSPERLNSLVSEWDDLISQIDIDDALKEGKKYSKIKWIEQCQTNLNELRLQEDKARAAYIQSVSTLQSTRLSLGSARQELAKARKDQLIIGESSSELREKGQRVESAQSSIQELESKILDVQSRQELCFGAFHKAKEESRLFAGSYRFIVSKGQYLNPAHKTRL